MKSGCTGWESAPGSTFYFKPGHVPPNIPPPPTSSWYITLPHDTQSRSAERLNPLVVHHVVLSQHPQGLSDLLAPPIFLS
jgi:hypothetical protein